MNKKVIISIIAVILLVAVLGTFLVACSAESYQKKLEKKGYTVSTYKPDKDEEDEIEWGITATKGALLNGDSVSVIKYKTLDDAKKAEQDAKDWQDNGFVSYEVYRSGKILFVGTKQGVKDAK